MHLIADQVCARGLRVIDRTAPSMRERQAHPCHESNDLTRNGLVDPRHPKIFDTTLPDERVPPKVYQEQYEPEYAGHEQDFLLAAREHGLDSKLVGELRDAGIRLPSRPRRARSATRRGAAVVKRFEGRLTEKQFESLRRWWISSVEQRQS
jgi:hypothetical protein